MLLELLKVIKWDQGRHDVGKEQIGASFCTALALCLVDDPWENSFKACLFKLLIVQFSSLGK